MTHFAGSNYYLRYWLKGKRVSSSRAEGFVEEEWDELLRCAGFDGGDEVPLWNRDRRESEVSLAKGKATLERLVESFLN